MSELTERMLHIRQIPVGAMLPAPVLRVIAAHLRERTFARGSLLMKSGEPITADSLSALYTITVATVVILYFPCRWFAALRSRRNDRWLSYL